MVLVAWDRGGEGGRFTHTHTRSHSRPLSHTLPRALTRTHVHSPFPGIITVPLMLRMGVQPKVASATSAVMIMYTAFTATTSYYVFGLVTLDYGAMGLLLGFGATFVGQLGLNLIIRRLGRDSLIVFSVALVVGVSALLMGTHSVIQIFAGGGGGGGRGVCG